MVTAAQAARLRLWHFPRQVGIFWGTNAKPLSPGLSRKAASAADPALVTEEGMARDVMGVGLSENCERCILRDGT